MAKPDPPKFAEFGAKQKIGQLPDLAHQSPHGRFVAVCERRKAPSDGVSGGALFSQAYGQYSKNLRRIIRHLARVSLHCGLYQANHNNHPIQVGCL